MPSLVHLAVFSASVSLAQRLQAVEFEPGDWLGIDGNWSTIRLSVGSPRQTVSVLASTSLSEIWTIGPGGCSEHDVYCATSRGGIYTPTDSKSWSSLGLWQLGLDYLGYGGNGQYGLDSLNARIPAAGSAGPGGGSGGGPGGGPGGSPGGNSGSGPHPGPNGGPGSTIFRMPKALMAAINTTDYWTGLFGLGINPGTFEHKTAQSPLIQAVQTYGLIPSYTYGYTAGASYKNAPVSLTLGGVDASRLIHHQIDFVLSPDNLPRALVRGIGVEIPDSNKTVPGNWESSSQALSTWDHAFPALIDSTTPYLWLPEATCAQFAQAFNLTYNSTFDLYTLSIDQYQDFMNAGSTYNFTFAFSSIDNHDNFGKPLEAPGVVNITLPIQAFVGLLQYPFSNAIAYGDPSVPYFAIKRSTNSSSFILGRSFLQEAYIVTKYDFGVFKLFQSQFTSRRLARIVAIKQPNGSPFPPPPSKAVQSDDLSTAQIIGLVVGAVVLSVLSLLSAYCYGRRRFIRRQRTETEEAQEAKDSSSLENTENRRSSASNIVARLTRRRRGQSQGSQARMPDFPTEVPNSEIHELAVPHAPIELDATDDHGYVLEEAEIRTNESELSAYEVARRRIDLQLQGPAPEYTPPADGVYLPPEKKCSLEYHQSSSSASQEDAIPISPQNSPLGNDSFLRTLPSPSPISPHADTSNGAGLALLATASIPGRPSSHSTADGAHLTSYLPPLADGTLRSSNASRPGTAQSRSTAGPPLSSRPFQKDPIDPSNIVCVGELPDSLQLLRQNIMASYAEDSDNQVAAAPRPGPAMQRSDDNLRSFYIDDPEDSTQGSIESDKFLGRQAQPLNSGAGSNLNIPLSISTQGLHPSTSPVSPWPKSAASEERMDGTDLVHVPQMAASRYSWEKD